MLALGRGRRRSRARSRGELLEGGGHGNGSVASVKDEVGDQLIVWIREGKGPDGLTNHRRVVSSKQCG